MQKWLFDISARINALVDVLDEADDKSVEPDIKNALQGIYESDVPKAVEDGIEYIKKQKALIASVKERKENYQEYQKFLENRLKRVERGYADFLLYMGEKKVETASGRMTVAAPTFSTKVDSIEDLPDEYKRTTVKIEPDAIAIKTAIQSGQNVPGAHLEERVGIRIK